MKTSTAVITAMCAAILLCCITVVILLHPKTASLVVNGETFTVRVADNPVTQYQGLSGLTPETLHADGMAFVFPSAEERTFIMRGMKFPLDFVWVRNGEVVDVDENVPAPINDEPPKIVSSAPLLVDTVFEFPAGFVRKHSILTGISFEFTKK